MSNDTTTDRTYLVDVRALGAGFKTYEVDAPNAHMATFFAESMAARDAHVAVSQAHGLHARLKPAPALVCGTCGEPELSEYASSCRAHTPDNMVEL